MLFPIRALAAVCLLAATSATAQDWPKEPRHRENWHYGFGLELLATRPTGDLQTRLDGRSGLGFGMQWSHFHSDSWLGRTRFEFNVFPESRPTDRTQDRVRLQNLVLSFDEQFFLMREPLGPYLLFGLGGIRNFLTEVPATTPIGQMDGARSRHTTRLLLTAGAGLRLANQVSLEARLQVSGLDKSADNSSLQVCMGWHF